MMRMAISFAMALCAGAALAGEGQSMAPLRDPWVPPAVRGRANPPAAASSDVMRAQVERKLRKDFDAADVEHRGSITRDQAVAAKLGVVADNFDAIDRSRAGRVTFEDYRRFLKSRGARTL